MRNRLLHIFIFLIALQLSACNGNQSKIDSAASKIEQAEKNKADLTEQYFENLELQMKDLERDLSENRKNYTEEQIKEIGKLQGRNAALSVKKRLNDFKKSLKDFGNQMEGFVEGLQSDTIENK